MKYKRLFFALIGFLGFLAVGNWPSASLTNTYLDTSTLSVILDNIPPHVHDVEEVAPGQPSPELQLDIEKTTTGFVLHLLTTHFTFSAVPETAVSQNISGVGNAHVSINHVEVAQLTSPRFEIDKAWLTEGVNLVEVRLNGFDGAVWTVGGQEVMAVALVSRDEAMTDNLVYQFAWDRGEAKEAEQGWTLTNDLNYAITLEDGFVNSAVVQLVPCVEAVGWWRVGTAYAGHGDSVVDVSRWVGPVVEEVGFPAGRTTPLLIYNQTYCQAHYLVAPDHTHNLPTLVLSGTYTAPDSQEARPFTIESDLTWGQIIGLNRRGPGSIALEMGDSVTVVVQRELGSLFDGIDFQTISDSDLAKAVLRNLTNNTTVIIE